MNISNNKKVVWCNCNSYRQKGKEKRRCTKEMFKKRNKNVVRLNARLYVELQRMVTPKIEKSKDTVIRHAGIQWLSIILRYLAQEILFKISNLQVRYLHNLLL